LVLREAGAIDCVVDAISQGFAAKLNSIGVVDDAIEDRVGESGVANDVVPLPDGYLTGDQLRTGIVAIFTNFEEIARCSAVRTSGPKSSKNQDVRSRERT
jgi:hypothetical protein